MSWIIGIAIYLALASLTGRLLRGGESFTPETITETCHRLRIPPPSKL